jgi:hypothetical protein
MALYLQISYVFMAWHLKKYRDNLSINPSGGIKVPDDWRTIPPPPPSTTKSFSAQEKNKVVPFLKEVK